MRVRSRKPCRVQLHEPRQSKQRAGIALFYVAALFYISWPLTLLVVALGVALGASLSRIYAGLIHSGTRLAELMSIESIDDFGPDRELKAVLSGGG